MITTVKKFLKWHSEKSLENKNTLNCYIVRILLGYLEEIILWQKVWLSVSFTTLITLLFFFIDWTHTNALEFIIYTLIVIIALDGLETWLIYKHRITALRKIAVHVKYAHIENMLSTIRYYFSRRRTELIMLRDSNHPKAFLMTNIILGFIFLIGSYLSGAVIIYIIVMSILLSHLLAPAIQKFINKIQCNLDSDAEIESLLPDESDVDMRDLNIEPVHSKTDSSVDQWQPKVEPYEDNSDSSDNSSYVTNLSKEKLQAIQGEETSDSSEEEYIPLVKSTHHYRTTLEVSHPDSWSVSALNALRSFGGNIFNNVPTTGETTRLVPRRDSSDGFEIVDENEL